VLDFGLAKAIRGDKDKQETIFSQTATMDRGDTRIGEIVGTPSYMSPEQARGWQVDQRTDIWAFGCVLYELLTGNRAGGGDTISATLTAVLDREPDWAAVPAKTPAQIRELLRGCLRKEVTHRIPDIKHVRRVLEQARRTKIHWRFAALTAAATAILTIVGVPWSRGPVRPAEVARWVRLTNFPDSVSQPALSPDGRMLTFIRGRDTFISPGQIWVKMLPDGEPVRLTHDTLSKMSPVFSPDGSRIAYGSTADGDFANAETWTVPLIGGQPRPWLANATGLVWLDKERVLFSEIKQGIQMGIVTSGANRARQRDVYLPIGHRDMAHRSYPSPDRKTALVVEMERGVWQPCRLIPMDGTSAGRRVGPPSAPCTFAAWSPDGEWMYFSSSSGGAFHTWRQRYPDGQLEQVTAGLTEEEGIAMAADGRSFVTAVAMKQSMVWVHDQNGERQISLEGYSYDPHFTPDGKKLIYRILKGAMPALDPGELRVVELDSGSSETVLPGLLVSWLPGHAYDISPDGRQDEGILAPNEWHLRALPSHHAG
jgi:dipeptidyl aminopeptidase/acylaminoacyl peptidase